MISKRASKVAGISPQTASKLLGTRASALKAVSAKGTISVGVRSVATSGAHSVILNPFVPMIILRTREIDCNEYMLPIDHESTITFTGNEQVFTIDDEWEGMSNLRDILEQGYRWANARLVSNVLRNVRRSITFHRYLAKIQVRRGIIEHSGKIRFEDIDTLDGYYASDSQCIAKDPEHLFRTMGIRLIRRRETYYDLWDGTRGRVNKINAHTFMNGEIDNVCVQDVQQVLNDMINSRPSNEANHSTSIFGRVLQVFLRWRPEERVAIITLTEVSRVASVTAEDREINEYLIRATFATYGSIDFTFDVIHIDGNAFIQGAIQSVNNNGARLSNVPLDDFVNIGEFTLVDVTWESATEKVFHFERSHFILREFMHTRSSAYVANVSIQPKGIMVHSVMVPNPTLRRHVGPSNDSPQEERDAHREILGTNMNNNCWNRPSREIGRQVAVHAWIGTTRVGTIATYQVLPWTRRSWHSGGGTGNDTHISFEIGELHAIGSSITDIDIAFFNAVYKEAVQFCAYLCRLFGFNPLDKRQLIDHYGGAFLDPPASGPSGDVTETNRGLFHTFGMTNNEEHIPDRLDTFRRHVADVLGLPT